MARFLGPLDIRTAGKRRWITLSPLTYESDRYGLPITVPAEFISDLASVPRAPLAFMLTGERAPGPAVLHDWLYQHDNWEDRALADEIFREAMSVNQPEFGFEAEPAAIRILMWSGVRAGGWWPWLRHGKRRSQLNPIWTATVWPEVQAA